MGRILSTPALISQFLPTNFTIDTLPPVADNLKKYAWTTDLHDGQPDWCLSDGVNWKPVRPWAAKVMTATNTDMTLQALRNSPTIILAGTALTANRAVNLSVGLAYSGAKFRLKRTTPNALFSFNVVGVVTSVLGLTAPWADFEYDPSTGWVQTASGSLL